MKKILTSESVTEGHPDKICDQISDAILDAHLGQDANSRVACECFITKDALFIGGEITSNAKVDIKRIAKQTIKKIGYTNAESGFDVENASIIVNLNTQSKDIAMGVNREKICAGDQGMVYGYACDETKEKMPFTISLAHHLAKRLAKVRKEGIIQGLYPDGKTQVSAVYDNEGNVESIDNIVIAAQHFKDIDIADLRMQIIDKVILKEVDISLLRPTTKIHINATGMFSKGGPMADSGLTGRKIIVDTYGGIARHGGGAFSGKDPSKSDRSAAYLGRYIAKNIIASKLAKKCEVEMAFVIGKTEPQTIYINTFGTNQIPEEEIVKAVKKSFPLSIDGAIKELELRKPIYQKLAAYGHFGREGYAWEEINRVPLLLKNI